MRTWGRITDPVTQIKTWVEVQTDANGSNDYVWVTTLIQCLLLNIGESPFYANYGIPAQQSVITQIFPDFYVAQMQTYFAPYFASLQISKVPGTTPVYNVDIVLNNGTVIQKQIAL